MIVALQDLRGEIKGTICSTIYILDKSKHRESWEYLADIYMGDELGLSKPNGKSIHEYVFTIRRK